MANLSDRATGLTNVNEIVLNELSVSPLDPAAGQKKLYAKDGKVFTLDSAGNEKEVGSGGGASVEILATDAEEQFVVGDVLYFNPSNSKYAKAIASSSSSAEVVGVVSEGVGSVGSYTSYIVTTAGYIEEGLSLPGSVDLTPGEVYFLSDSVAGLLTTSEPSAVGYVSRPVLLATGTNKGFVLPYRGVVVGGANARTQISLPQGSSQNVQDFSSYEAAKLDGYVYINGTTDYRFYIEAQVSKNGAGDDYNLSYQTSGDTPPVGFDVAISSAGMLSITLPSDAALDYSAYINYALNAPAVGVTLPLSIDAEAVTGGVLESARLPLATSTTAGAVVGLKQYEHGTDFTFTTVPAGWSLSHAYAIPYQTVDGTWRMRFSINATTNSSLVKTLRFTGVSFAYVEALSVLPTGSGVVGRGYTFPGTNPDEIKVDSNVNDDQFRVAGDVQLTAKPTWAD